MKKSSRFMNVGGASVIVIFVVLCLSMLGALAVSSSYADLRLSSRYRDSVVAYYKADGSAQKKIFLLKEMLLKPPVTVQMVTELIPDGKIASQQDSIHISFMEPIDEKQSIDVRLFIDFQTPLPTVSVTNYKAVRTQKDDYEKSNYRLWDGTFDE